MIGLVRYYYNRIVGHHFFYKLILIYAAIIVATIGLLVYIIIFSITNMLREQAINYNEQVLQTVNVYFYNQNQSLKKIVNNLYTVDWGSSTQVINSLQFLFEGKNESSDSDAFNQKIDATRELNGYLANSALPADSDIKDVMLANPSFGFHLNASRSNSIFSLSDYFATISKTISQNKTTNINARKDNIIPAFLATRGSSVIRLYCLYDYIRDVSNSSSSLGYAVVTYSPDSVRNSYSQFQKYLIGDILIVTDTGGVIYDSSGKYYDKAFPFMDRIKSSGGGSFQNHDYIFNTLGNGEFGYTVVGMISKQGLYGNVNSLNWFILSITFVCICLILIFTVLSTKRFSKRVGNINETLIKIQRGNLDARAQTKGESDEIGQISDNLNLMSEKLNDYIKREYVAELNRANAELKQKTAELYALQSQINPHFLYNTLEAIRMLALSSGESSVAEMIKILGKLFRSNVKGEIALSIQDELSYCRSYLELYSIRFQDRLQVVYDIDPAIMDFAIVKHTLQPILENSIVHGLNINKPGNVIRLCGRICNGMIEIVVSDNGQGISMEALNDINSRLKMPRSDYKENIGIFNVNSRIRLIYGENYGLSISSMPGQGTEVVLKIPCLTKEELMSHVQSPGR